MNIIVKNGEPNTDYTLRLNTTNAAVSTIHNTFAGDAIFTVTPNTTTIYNVIATSSFGCIQRLRDISTVTLNPSAMVPIQSDQQLVRRP